MLLDVEGATGWRALELGHLREPQLLELELAANASTCDWNGTGWIRNSTSPAFTGLLASTATSTTSPATSGTIDTELRKTTRRPAGAPQPWE